MRRIMAGLALLATGVAGFGFTATGGKDKVSICHKPGTAAEQTLEVPKQAVPGHLGHGDYLGACQGETTTITTTTETTTTEATETTPTPSGPPCPGNPGGERPDPPGGKDGRPGNDDCVEDEAASTSLTVTVDTGSEPLPAVPPVFTTPKPTKAPTPDAAPVKSVKDSTGRKVLVKKQGGKILVKRPGDAQWQVAIPGSG